MQICLFELDVADIGDKCDSKILESVGCAAGLMVHRARRVLARTDGRRADAMERRPSPKERGRALSYTCPKRRRRRRRRRRPSIHLGPCSPIAPQNFSQFFASLFTVSVSANFYFTVGLLLSFVST